MSLEIDHSGLGAAYLRSHPDVPISHRDGEPCGWCTRAGITVGGDGLRAAIEAVMRKHDPSGSGFARWGGDALLSDIHVALAHQSDTPEATDDH